MTTLPIIHNLKVRESSSKERLLVSQGFYCINREKGDCGLEEVQQVGPSYPTGHSFCCLLWCKGERGASP